MLKLRILLLLTIVISACISNEPFVIGSFNPDDYYVKVAEKSIETLNIKELAYGEKPTPLFISSNCTELYYTEKELQTKYPQNYTNYTSQYIGPGGFGLNSTKYLCNFLGNKTRWIYVYWGGVVVGQTTFEYNRKVDEIETVATTVLETEYTKSLEDLKEQLVRLQPYGNHVIIEENNTKFLVYEFLFKPATVKGSNDFYYFCKPNILVYQRGFLPWLSVDSYLDICKVM